MQWLRGLTRYQWLVLMVAWLGWVFDIADQAIFNLVKTPMLKEMIGEAAYKQSGAGLEARIQTVFLVGWSIGGLVFGLTADRWGRTRTLTITILLYCFCTGLTALCHTPDQVAFTRFLAALGIGGEWAAGAALIAEVLPDAARAAGAALLQTAAAFGPAAAALANLFLAHAPWQWLFLVGVVPALLTVIIRLKVKEPERAEKAEARQASLFAPLKELFATPEWRKRVLAATVIGVVGIIGAGTLSFWLPNLVTAVSNHENEQARKSFVTFIQQGGTLLGVLAAPFIAEKLGRKLALGLFFILCPLSVGALTLASGTYQGLLVLAPVASFFAIGLSGIYPLYFPELFPTRIRGTGAGFAYNTGRILSAPFPLLTAMLMTQTHSPALGVLLSSAVYACGLLALPFAPETRGRPLPA
jgi:MFS family permease